MRNFLFTLIAAYFLTGCAGGFTPKQQLAALDSTFTTIVEETTHKRKLGQIPDDVWECFNVIAIHLDGYLNVAWANVTLDRPEKTNSMREVQQTLRDLELSLQTGEGVGTNVCGEERYRGPSSYIGHRKSIAWNGYQYPRNTHVDPKRTKSRPRFN